MAEAEANRSSSLGALLNGVAQQIFYRNSDVTEEMLKSQLYPEATQQHFKALYDKMKALLMSMATADMDHAQLEAFLTAQTRKQGAGGVTPEQAAALARFWKAQRGRVHESLLLAQSRWEPTLRGLSWRVDLQTAVGRGGPPPSGPVALLELELGGGGGKEPDFVCLEMNDHSIRHMLKKMADIQAAVEGVVQGT
ncbi:COMM domain-containing protein 1 [Phycodurus eques]|uniref:COMM domain-containing protein 1 n=1 Tax=Phycodurus eques TaxID=693459 RepID=UPI002ACE2D05|nr:COMM domain-containing protein 1 [Phycodurus eques]XP_061536489.1 COMM domain-containing protein 1 [Phycodurus eques]